MKIAYFLDIPVGLGGAGNLLLQRAKLMSELYEIIVVIPCDENKICNLEYALRCKKYGLRYKSIYYNTSYNFYDVDILGAYESYNDIEKLVIDEKITFLHSVQLNVVVEMVSRNLKIPHLMDTYQIDEAEFDICSKDIFAHYHLCDSILYSEVWKKNMNLISKCLRPLAPLKEIVRKESYSTEKFTILMLGTVSERKNQLSAIKVIEKCILKYDMKLLIAGDKNNPYGEECERYIREAKLEKNIHMLDFLSDVTDVLKESDCLLCTSLDESFPSSLVEAVTYDLTIISTPVAGVPEVFENNYNAFISKDFSEESIYNTVYDCLESYKQGTINRIHENLLDTWKNNFDRSYVQEQLSIYYNYIKEDIHNNQELRPRIIYEIESMYNSFRKVYEKCPETKRRCLYHHTLKNKILNKEIYIWGAGLYGSMAYELVNSMSLKNVKIISFVDKNKEGNMYEFPIIKPDEMIFDENKVVFISFYRNKESAISYLENKGLELNKNIWIVP